MNELCAKGNRLATVAENLHTGAGRLKGLSESPRLDAEMLLGKVLGWSRSALFARGNETVTSECQTRYGDLLQQRMKGAPVAYLTGVREFWSLQLTVNPEVLVPRPETELLVERALQLLPADRPCSVLDLGTGSGAIALAIASERPAARVTGVDISPGALAVAVQNSRHLGCANVDWQLGSWFDTVGVARFDLIVANPPYVAAADPAMVSLAAEPAIALSSGPTGLEALCAIAADAPRHLTDGAWLLLEHGSGQGADVARLLHRHGFSRVETLLDLSAKPRVTLGTVHPQH